MIKKIKKLLRLAGDQAASPAEAANALQRAIDMAQKAGLDIDQIDPDEDDGNAGLHHDSAPISALGDAEKVALAIVRRHFPVEPFLNFNKQGKRIMQFVGTRDGCQLATYVFAYLVRVMRKSWADNPDRRLKRPAYMVGFGSAIDQLMPDTFKSLQGMDLVVSTEDYIQRNLVAPGGKVSVVNPRISTEGSRGSVRRGYEAGQKAGIRNGLRGGTTNIE